MSDSILFFRLLQQDSKGISLLDSLSKTSQGLLPKNSFIAQTQSFRKIPGSPFAYWVSNKMIELFDSLSPLESPERNVRVGDHPGDGFRYLRLTWEAPLASKDQEWRTYQKGGSYSPFYFDQHLLVNWDKNRQTYRGFIGRAGRSSEKPSNYQYFFKPGLTWPRRSQKGLSVRVHPAGCVFADKGPVIFANQRELPVLLGLTNSAAFRGFVSLQMAFGSYEVGVLQRTPVPDLSGDDAKKIGSLACECANLKRKQDCFNENSHVFYSPLLLQVEGENISDRILASQSLLALIDKEIAVKQQEIDEISFGLYGIHELDKRAIESSADVVDNHASEDLTFSTLDEDDDSAMSSHAESTARDLVSYFLGSAFGRWDIRLVISEQDKPVLPDLFDALPKFPPGQLLNPRGLPSLGPEDLSALYPLNISWEGILVDDPSHPLDLELRVSEVVKIIWCSQNTHSTSQDLIQEICIILREKSLRDYFFRPARFFSDHLKRYSKSRKQAPVYWLLSAGSCNYSAWLYYHRFTHDTIYRLLHDFVQPRILLAERDLFEMESQGTLSGDAANRIQETQSLLIDLEIFRRELDYVAPLWCPDLNDGVIINHSILWRITPYVPWQKKCKECWVKLVKGDYDWAHLAFHLWPERVIAKCTTDRSLAIAHGLEERLWQETNNGNWLPRQLSEADLEALIAEHSNLAVKNALEKFLAAPPPVVPAKKRAKRASTGSPRKSRSSASAPADPEIIRQVLFTLTAAPDEGLSKNAIAELQGVEPTALTAVIKQLKTALQIEQLGAARGAKYRLTAAGRSAIAADTGADV